MCMQGRKSEKCTVPEKKVISWLEQNTIKTRSYSCFKVNIRCSTSSTQETVLSHHLSNVVYYVNSLCIAENLLIPCQTINGYTVRKRCCLHCALCYVIVCRLIAAPAASAWRGELLCLWIRFINKRMSCGRDGFVPKVRNETKNKW